MQQKRSLFSSYSLAIITAIIVIASVFISTSQLRSFLTEQTLDNLSRVNHKVEFELHRQFDAMVLDVKDILADPESWDAINQVIHQQTAASIFKLRQSIATEVFSRHYQGFYVISLQQTILASMKDKDINTNIPQLAKQRILASKQADVPLITHPFLFHNKPVIWTILHIKNKQNKTIGYLALEAGQQHALSQITLITGVSGQTMETYLVNESGMIISESRFTQQLKTMGLLQNKENSSLHLRVADLGDNLPNNVENLDIQQAPLTLAVQKALEEKSKSFHMQGYHNYIGQTVMGVWEWDSYLQAAIITEINMDEALASYFYVRNLIYTLLVIIILALIIAAFVYNRFRIRQEREANKHRNLLLESTAEAIYGIDLNGDCTFVNQSFLKLMGYKKSEIIGVNIHELIHHSHADKTTYPKEECEIYQTFQDNKDIHRKKDCFWHKDGHAIYVEFWAHPLIEDGKAVGAVVTFLDISAQLQAEHERTQMEKQVQHSQRLESLGVLAGGIAHDFNNFLAAILGNASLVETNILKDPIKAKERTATIIRAAEKAGVLCKQMLAYSGKGQFYLKPINMTEIVEEMTQLLEVSIEKTVVLKYHLTENLPLIMVDEAQIQQVIMNLVTNANDAIGKKSGLISVTTGIMYADEEYLESCLANKPQPGRYVYVEVSDTGCGMDKATLDKVFDPFFTTKMTGRGLGMSAVLGIVRGHDGALRVYSEPNHGSTFKFLLPIDESNKNMTPEKYIIQPFHALPKGKVLVVDDEESVREMTCMMLEEMGFSTVSASDGQEAIDIYKQDPKSYLFVMTDLTMPHMDGKELFSQLKNTNPDCRIILNSGYNSQDAIQQFSGKGLAGFIQKPFTATQLQEAIKEVLGGGV